MAAIELDNVKKEFEELTAINNIDLTVRENELLVLVGPSGCGKSTTLRLISGLEKPTSGTVSILGEKVNSVPPKDRDIAMVFQEYALYPHLSARKNMTFGLKSVTDFSAEEIKDKVENAAEILDITDLLDRKPAALSGGEQQRVAIGRAIVRNPEVYLMDEPLSNLDAELRVSMRGEILELQDHVATPIVYVTHDQTEAMTLGDRVAVMKDGQIQQVDEPQTLYDYPQNTFVAGFIGEPAMNLMDATMIMSDGQFEISNSLLSITSDCKLPQKVIDEQPNKDVILGIRPENLQLSPDQDNHSGFELDIEYTENLGNYMLIHGENGGEHIQIQHNESRRIFENQTITVYPDLNRLHVFDSDTGEIIFHSNMIYPSGSDSLDIGPTTPEHR